MSDQALGLSLERLAFIERRIKRIRLTRRILQRASQPFATHIRTLDAIHLASALSFMEATGEELRFATADRQLATAAAALGLETIFLGSRPEPLSSR